MDYERSKATHDQVLLRLEKGDLARLDDASTLLGLSRSAFARMFLAPVLNVVAARLARIDAARAGRRQSLAQFLSAAIEESLARVGEPHTDSPAATEFDELFGPDDGAG